MSVDAFDGVDRAHQTPQESQAGKGCESAMNNVTSDPARILHGIDFSGNYRMWTPGCGRSNVWIATAKTQLGVMKLAELRPVQHLPGSAHPFERLFALLERGDYCAAAIDAPFSLPARHVPAGGLPKLLRDVESFPTENRPFAQGADLVAYARQNASLQQRKPLRNTERAWADKGVNIRSTLWNGPRGGAPFTVACLTLLARVGGPVWPWMQADRGLLVEAFPAGQLHDWELEHQGYAESGPSPNRVRILEDVSRRIEIPDSMYRRCRSNADALDAVLCLFAAKAALEGQAAVEDSAAAENEGWIATHPG